MSFDSEARRIGNQPIRVIELQPDKCSLVWGVGACPAQGSGDSKCFNTFGTCPVQDSFARASTTVSFVDKNIRPLPGLRAFPAIIEVDYAGTTIEPGGGLGESADIKITFQDFVHNDHGIDPYVDDRTYDTSRGTFWGKWLTRNRHYRGRPVKLREGYVPASGPFTFTHFRDRTYYIRQIDPPDKNGKVVLHATDKLAKTNEERALCPRPTAAYLVGSHDSVTSTFTLVNSEQAYAVIKDEENADKYARINDEIIKVGTQSGQFLIDCDRGQGGTMPASHLGGDVVQHAKAFTGVPVTSIYRRLLTGFSPVASDELDWIQWQQESNALDAFTLTTIIAEPTPVDELINELNTECLVNLWDEDLDGTIKLKLETPWSTDVASLNDERHLVDGSVRLREAQDMRVDEVLFYFGMRNYIEDRKPENMRSFWREVSSLSQSANAYGEPAIQVIHSRWFTSANSGQVAVTARRKVERFRETPIELEWQLQAKDVSSVSVGSVINITTRQLPDMTGLAETVRVQVLETNVDDPGVLYSYRGLKYFGAPNVNDVFVISSNHQDYVLWNELSQPSAPRNITVRNDAVLFGVSSGGLLLHGMPYGSVVTFVNCGQVYGYPGEPGAGGHARSEWDNDISKYVCTADDGGDGLDGGDAIVVPDGVTLIIHNAAGYIRAGGGGGPGGPGYARFDKAYGGAGGGAGRGYQVNSGGQGGDGTTSTYDSSGGVDITTVTPAPDGQWSSVNTVGDGGTQITEVYSIDISGGGGGDWGEAGSPSSSPLTDGEHDQPTLAFGIPGTVGAPGLAIRTIGAGSVVFVNGNVSDRVKGAID